MTSLYDSPRQKTIRAYLQAPMARRLVMLMRDHKIVNLELQPRTHLAQKGAALLLLGEDGEPLPFRESEFLPMHGGFPHYTLDSFAKNGAKIRLTVFADNAEFPQVYLKLTVTNPTDTLLSGSVGFLPCTAGDDRYLTGLWDTGYGTYQPNPRVWTMLDQTYALKNGVLSDGYAQIAFSSPEALAYHGTEDDFFAFSHFVTRAYALAPGESFTETAVFSLVGHADIRPYDAAERAFFAFWQGIFDQITVFPRGCTARERDVYLSQVSQTLQMLAVYDDNTVYPRQGCVGRFVWAWEAAHFLTVLDRIGLASYTREANRTLLTKWMITDPSSPDLGKIANPHVNWANTNGSVIWCVSEHLRVCRDEQLLAEWLPYLEKAVGWIEKRRHETNPGDVSGLFPSAVASDWAEVGQHYTYTDSVNVMGYRKLAEMLEGFHHPQAPVYRALYEDYFGVLQKAMDELIAGHDESEDYLPTHILGKDFASVRTHCYTTDGTVYLPMCGNLDASSRFFGFVERFYQKHGMLGPLRARMTNLDYGEPSYYGDCYYTGVAETCWFYIYLQKGDRKGAREMLDSVLYFNLTDEHIAAERWTPLSVWYAPWQPNASASGRIMAALLDYYGEEERINA